MKFSRKLSWYFTGVNIIINNYLHVFDDLFLEAGLMNQLQSLFVVTVS